MKAKKLRLSALVCTALLMGCATQRELIEKRIGQKADFFATLSPASQQRLRDGQVVSGDPLDAAWIVYGKPDRVFQKVTGTTTNEVWSYVAPDLAPPDSSRPVYHSVRTSNGRTLLHRDNLWATDMQHTPYEYLRIEFQDAHVLTLESEQQ